MHILLIHQAFALPKEAGGTRHFELARHCVGQGHKVTVVASGVSYLSGRQVTGRAKPLRRESVEGVEVRRAYILPSLHRSFVWRVISFVSFMLSSIRVALSVKDVDLVMGTSPPIFQAVSAWLVASIRRRPFLLEIRDLWPEFAVDMGVLKNPILIALSRWLESFLYARATHLLVNSPAYKEYLVSKGVVPSKITLIANGVDPDQFFPEANGRRMRQSWGLSEEFVVMYAGALGAANDIPTILNAAARLRDQNAIKFVLVGDGKERTNLEAMAREKGLRNVMFTGAMPKSAMCEALAASSLCLATLKDIPMFKTTYPNKVFDYMAAGRATVLGIDGVIRRVVESARGGVFVPPGNDEALASAIRMLAEDPVRVREMGRLARAYVVQHFNRNTQADAFARFVEQFAGEEKRAAIPAGLPEPDRKVA